MDSYREHPSDFDLPSASEEAPSDEINIAIGNDERRMHVRAYNYWVSLLDGRDFPSIEDLEPAEVTDFAANSVLLDFTCGRDNPAVPYIGAAIRDECGLSDDTRTIADVPSRSLLSRLTDHYLQIIANRAPIGFEAEFANQRQETICYRGILMPFSSDGETIDFIYGVINWKRVGAVSLAGLVEAEAAELLQVGVPGASDAQAMEEPLELSQKSAEEPFGASDDFDARPFEGSDAEAVEEPLELSQESAEEPFEAGHDFDARPLELVEGPLDLSDAFSDQSPDLGAEFADATLELTEVMITDAIDGPLELTQEAGDEGSDEPSVDVAAVEFGGVSGIESSPPHFAWEDGPLADVEAGELPVIELDENAALADRLWAARETADAVKAGEGRTRAALYHALSLAYDFALAAQQDPAEYAELLEESGVKAQARAPMTPIVKLVFGIDYDKARLTEFAAALSYALRQDVALGAFQDFIEKQAGGLKALVAAERQARRPEPRTDAKGDIARARLRALPTISLSDVPAEEEFAVIVTRRGANGTHEPVAIVDDEALVERAICRTA